MVFLGDIAFILEVLVVGLGFIALHYALKENAKLMKIGAYILIVVGILSSLCTGYYWMKYFYQGEYSTGMHSSRMMHGMMGKGCMMHEKMMGKGNMMNMMSGQPSDMPMMKQMMQCMQQAKGKMMDESQMKNMQNCMMMPANSDEHKSHHPDS